MINSEAMLDYDTDILSDDSDNEYQDSRESRKRIADDHEDSEDDSKRIKLVYDNDNKCVNNYGNEDVMFYHKEGLANSLHGSIYQLKLQMLFLKRALDKDYNFQLGTEVEDAGKFDDIVFKYKRKDETGNHEIRFVQAKHRLDDSKKITEYDLLKARKDGDFSLQKYFISYCKIKENPEFRQSMLKDLILYTNIDFNYEDLRKLSVEVKETAENDAVLKITKSSKTTKRLKLCVPKGHEIYDKLRETSDVHILANTLKQHILKKIPLQLTGIFKVYHYALSKTVFHIVMPYATFRDEFLNGEILPVEVLNFRNILQSSLELQNIDQFKKALGQITLPVSKRFAESIDLYPNPIINDSKYLAKTLAYIIIKAQNKQKKVIAINRTSDIIDLNINKLAFHILVQDKSGKDLIRFGKIFFDEARNLEGNLDDFRADLKSEFEKEGVDFSTLNKYKFKISKFYTCEETSEGDLIKLKTELPKDKVEDAEVEDFLDKLVFAVNQPNEVELGEIIAEEMGQDSHFNLLDVNLVSNSFQRKMLDWFKEKRPEKGKEGAWLDAKSGGQFMDSIEEKVSALISVGIGIAYPDELATYGIRFDKNEIFEKIKTFLSKENVSEKIFCINPKNEALLSSINVYSSLETLKKQDEYTHYLKNDSYIFMRFKTLSGEKTQQYAIRAFNSPDSYHLLILDCECIDANNSQNTRGLCRKLSKILTKMNKKIIIITKEQNTFVDDFDEDLKSRVITDDSTFFDLTDKSKDILLQKQVIFQGRGEKICLNELINQTDEKAKDIINAGIMVKLLKGKEISIGSKLKDLNEVDEYYVSRKFKPVVFSRANIQKQLEENNTNSDLFVVTGGDPGFQHNNIYAFNNAQSAEEKFNELVIKNYKSNIHWLETDSNYLTWYKSHGSIKNLMPHGEQKVHTNDCMSPRLIEESNLIGLDNDRNGIIIISGAAGMGKSTVLTKFSMNLIKDPNLWVIRINLNDYTDNFDKLKTKEVLKSIRESAHNLIDFLFNNLLVLQGRSKFEKDLFTNNFKNHSNVALLFDGFDEICPDYACLVIGLIRSLRKYKVKKIIVTTRPNFREELENALDVFSSVLEPFSKEEQVKFLVKFWTKNLELNNLHTNKIYIYAKSIIEQVCKCINDKEHEFVSNPLQLMMVAEVFQESNKAIGVVMADVKTTEWQGCKEFLESDHDLPKISKGFSLVKLYDHFIERKYFDFYLRDKEIKNLTKVSVKKGKVDSNEEYNIFKTKNGLLAMQLLFNENELKELLSPSDINKLKGLIGNFDDGEHFKGIIDQIIESKPHFIHRTFAEYFAAILIAEKILTSPSATLRSINNVLLNMSPIFMHTIIDLLQGKYEIITSALGKPLMHFILRESCLNFFRLLIRCNYSDWQKKLDASGKTPLHYAVECRDSDNVVKLFKYADDIHTDTVLRHGSFKYPEYEHCELVKFVNVKDNDGKSALYYAIQQSDYDVAFELLLKGASISLLTDDNINALIRHMIYFKNDGNIDIYENGILGAYANQDNKYRPIQEKLFLRAPGFFNKLCRKDQSRILSYFSVHGRVQAIDTLLATINDPEERKQVLNNGDNGCTPFDRVLVSDELSDENRLEITKYLLEHDGLSKSSSSYSEVSAMKAVLLAAAEFGHIKTLNFFINLEEHSDFNDIVYRACEFHQLMVVKYMYENYKDRIIDSDGNTGLHAACDIGRGVNLEIIKYLINYDDVNVKNYNGETPLIMAKRRNKQFIIHYLISKGAINDSNEDNIANRLLLNNESILEDPVQNNFGHVDKHGYPKLHSAIIKKQFELAKFLVRRGANINEKDTSGDAPLHLCVTKSYNSEFVELLLQYGAIFNIENKSNKTPYDLISASSNHCEVFWLLRVLTKLFSSQNLMKDLNKELLKCDDWGPYGSGHPDVWDSTNPMLYILNPRNNQGKTLLHIAADTNDINALHTLLKFNNGYLGRKLESKLYPRYEDYQSTSVDSLDVDGNAPIHLAARKGNIVIVRNLLEKGAKFNSNDSKGDNPEEIAANENHTNIVNLLQPTKHLFVALEKRVADEIEKCVKANVFINAKNQAGKTALHLAANINKLVAQLLLDNGADIEAVDDNGDTPLHIAAANDKINIVMLLTNSGAIYDAKNTHDKKPLDLAHGESCDLLERIDKSFQDIQSDEPQVVVSKLKTYDEDVIAAIVHSRDHEGNTLLHYAARVGDYKIVEFLLGNGAVYETKNILKESPLYWTHDQNIKLLLNTIDGMFENLHNIYEGVKTINVSIIKNALDSRRKTLLDYATDRHKPEIISFLKDLIADG